MGQPASLGYLRDISDHKQIEENLRQSEERYRNILESIQEGYFELDLDGNYTFANEANCRYLGYAKEELIGMNYRQHTDEETAKKLYEPYYELYRTGKPIELLDLESIRKDGTKAIYETSVSLIKDNKGNPIGFRGVSRDITARKRAEEALRVSEKKYRLIAENTADLISTLDMNLHVTYVSPASMRLRGFTVEEAMEQPLEQVLTPESMRLALTVFEKEMELEASGTADPDRMRILELEEYKKDGSTVWVEVSMSFLRDNDPKPVEILIVTRDITDRKRVEEALRKSEANYRQLFDNSPTGIYQIDFRTGKFLKANDLICEYLGCSQEEITSLSPYDFITKESQELLLERLSKMAIGDKIPEDPEYEVIDKNGKHRWLKLNSKNIYDSEGLLGADVVAHDITDRKRVEEEKRRLEERLQRAHKMEAIGTLAGGIAHDFNNLLMAIQGYTSLTLLTLDLDDPNRERLKIIQEQVQSGAELTRQLLGFARGGRYEVKPADINDVIQKTSSMFGRTKKEITIHMKYEKNLSPVEVDLGQMEQVFMNLYVNAWQAMPGGGEIYLQTENVFLNNKQALSYSVKPGKYVKITVTDTGTGIDEKTRERIFDPFFTTKAMGRGAGLGLATVYGIIKGHKGMINVYSEPGHGTTFTIYLPASEKKVVKKETATGTIDRGTETILLVDDEKIVLEANREMLESMGYRVYAVGSGQEAIALFMGKRNEIDLVILDMIMPGISGGETFDRLREINPEIKVLLSSGYSLNGEAQTIMDRGCKGFIQKPFQIEKLSQKVREMLD
jgi:PAS domain S-box-containing protein